MLHLLCYANPRKYNISLARMLFEQWVLHASDKRRHANNSNY
ncbi:protein of unknown function [Xenorhabdus doucetiae]|uniref:Uncharacterized protein n=1 Tax=Xenorhabdus doucetiae TaxID=351671 RepID=A0A068QU17_9GAMM|nr:protein of unknown function [Xenorhabdus doucetiae]